jgi:hypothetical protein
LGFAAKPRQWEKSLGIKDSDGKVNTAESSGKNISHRPSGYQ